MAIPAWYWPGGSARARGRSLVPFASGFAVADWTAPGLWRFSTSFGAFTSLTQLTGIATTGIIPQGLAAATGDASGNLFTISYGGASWVQPPTGAATNTNYLSGTSYVGVGVSSGATPYYALTVDGNIAPSLAGLFNANCMWLAVSANSGWTLVSSGVASASFAGGTPGATGFLAYPTGITVGTCIAIGSGTALAVGGYASAALLSGFSALTYSSVNSTSGAYYAFGATGNTVAVLTAPTGNPGNWSVSGTATFASPSGASGMQSIAVLPNGTQLLIADNGRFDVIDYSAGALSWNQSGSFFTASQIIAPSNTDAVANSTTNLRSLYLSGSTWVSAAITITDYTSFFSLAVLDTTHIAVAANSTGGTSGVLFLSGGANNWNITSYTSASTHKIATLTVDERGLLYGAGQNVLYVFSGSAIIASGAFTGNPASGRAMAVAQGRAIVASPASNNIQVLGVSGSISNWGSYFTQSTTLTGGVKVTAAPTTLLTAMANGTNRYTFAGTGTGTPWTLHTVHAGTVALWTGGTSWFTASLGVDEIPSALAFDASGNLWVATERNDLFYISPSGTILSTGIVASYQAQTVPLGTSSMCVSGAHLYAATSLAGVLIEAV